MAKTIFGATLRDVRSAVHMTQRELASIVGRMPTQVYRWEQGGVVPRLEDRLRVLRALANAPRADLERLAAAADTTLRSAGIEDPPAPPPPPAPSPSPVVASAVAAAPLSPLAQGLVDDAVREAAEETAVSPQLLRPALSRMLDRIARAGVPIEAATRMVLGVPKKPEKGARA